MQITVSDDLATVARLAELTEQEAQWAWIIGLFAEQRLSLVQAARLAGLDRHDFQQHLAARGISVAPNFEKSPGADDAQAQRGDKPWLALRGSGRFVGDPFGPVVSEEEIAVLQDGGIDTCS